MSLRPSVLFLLLTIPLAGCNALKSIQIIPGSGVQTLSSPGQTAQFKAVELISSAGHPLRPQTSPAR
jgi:hypothetical protein